MNSEDSLTKAFKKMDEVNANRDEYNIPVGEVRWLPDPEPLISLRDQIAMRAMQGLLSNGMDNHVAERAYEYADALLREKGNG
jgi:hypothetical protein